MTIPKAKAMKAKELYDAGLLVSAIAELSRELKKAPGDEWSRATLFELLCLNGEWDRAEKLLLALSLSSVLTEAAAQINFNNIRAERARARFFKTGSRPCFLIEPPGYISHYLDANEQLRKGELCAARTLLDHAEQQRRAISGEINGSKFQDFRDSNDLTAPVLEMFVTDKYYWLPFQQISRITIDRSRPMSNPLWTRARIDTINGSLGDLFLPMLYAGSCDHESSLVRLGRTIEWQAMGSEIYMPAGRRLFLTDSVEVALAATTDLVFAATSKRACRYN